MDFKNRKKKRFDRYNALLIVMLAVFSVIIARLTTLQVIMGEEYAERANDEFIKNLSEKAPRGDIIDSKGNILATSVQSYKLVYVDTAEARKEIYNTIDKVNSLLQKAGESASDFLRTQASAFQVRVFL